MIDQRANLFASVGGIQRFRAALHRITHAVRLRAPPPMPKRMQRQFFAGLGPREQRFWHYRETATNSSEPANLGKTSQLDCALMRAGNFKNGMRYVFLGNIR